MGAGQLNIALFTPSAVAGGAERAIIDLANGFSDRNHETHLLLASPTGDLLPDVRSSVKRVILGTQGVLASLLPLRSFLRENQPDILLSAQTHANLVALWARGLSRASTKLVLSEHTTISVNFAREPGWKNMAILPLVRNFFAHADAFVCVSQGVALDLMKVAALPAGRVRVIYNPVLTPEFSSKAAQRPTHPWLVSRSHPVILAVGRLTAAKDYPTLLRAFQLVSHQREARLLILGEGERRADLEALVDRLGLTEFVSMPGFDPNPAASMSSAAVLVLSSAWEGLPSVLVEALACGTPVVATDCPSGPSEILDHGRFGRLVPVGDPPALAAALIQTLDARPDRAVLQDRAKDFALENAVEAYLDLFTTLCDK